jgi:Domain of unknown function (DUF4386)
MYLLTIVASIPAQFVLYHPVLSNAEYVLGAGHDSRHCQRPLGDHPASARG